MKKFFSAILLMTMMVFSVGTFVSCNDLVTEIEDVKGQTTEQAAAIKALENEIAALETALATAQKAADDAKAAANDAKAAAAKAQADADAANAAAAQAQADANDAKAAAAQAKADAIKEAKDLVENLKAAFENDVKALEDAIAGKADKAVVDAMQAEIEKKAQDVATAIAVINTSIENLVAKDAEFAAQLEKIAAQVAELLKTDEAQDAQIAELLKADATFEGKIAELLKANTDIKTQIAALEAYNATQDGKIAENKAQIDSILIDLADVQTQLEDIWAEIGDPVNGLRALVGTNAGLIEDLYGKFDSLYAEVFGEGPNSLSSSVGTLANIIEDLRGDIEELGADIEANKKAVEMVNANLSIYSTLIGDLANRIQSITFVPETVEAAMEKRIHPLQYTLGQGNEMVKSPFMIRATYEVTPKGLVNTLADENLFFSTVELKAAAAEYLQAKIVERDGATGRMVVIGYLPEDSEAYKLLHDGSSVAFALNITDNGEKIYNIEDKDGLQQTIDAGKYIASEYIYTYAGASYAYELQNAFRFQYVDEETEKTVYSNNYYNLEEVAYKTSIENSKRNLFEVDDIVVDFQGSVLTKEQVKNILGIDYTLTVPQAKVTYNAAPGKKSPVAVTGKDLTATAAFVASDDYKGAAAVGQYAHVVLEGFKVNDITTNLLAEAHYEVDFESADITLTKPATIPWSYRHATTWSGWFSLADAEELNVSGTDDITKLKDIYGNVMSPNSVIAFEGEAVDSKGVTHYAWVEVCALSKKAVRFTGGAIPYAKGEKLTYKFESILYDENAIEYTVAFEATTDPMPTDKTITLDTKVNGRLSNDMSAAVELLNETLVADASFYPEATSQTGAAYFFEGLMNTNPSLIDAATTVQKYDPAKAKYVDINNNNNFELVTTLGVKNGKIYDASEVTIAEGAATFGDKFIFTKKVNLFGVDYTYVVNAEVVKPGYALSYNATYVDNGVVTLGGKVGLPSYSTSSGTFTSSEFVLQAIDLRRYVIVENEVAGELMLQYNLTTRLPDAQNKPTIIPDITYEAGPMTTDAYEANIVGWNDKTLNKVEFEISLVSKATTVKNGQTVPAVVYDTKKVVLEVPDFVSFDAPAANIEKVAYKSGEVNVGNIAQTLVIKDAETGKVNLKNPYAKRLDQIFFGAKQEKVGTTKTNTVDESNPYGYAVYGQKVTAKADKVSAYLETSGATVDPQDYKYYTTETVEVIDGKNVTFYPGDVRLMIEDANITDNIIVVVPVELTHDYCGSKVHKTVEAKVKFTK